MIAFVMSALLVRVGQIAAAASELAEHLPKNRPFELSDDGEYLFSHGDRYDFVGFSENGRFTVDSGETIRPRARLGHVVGESGCNVCRTSTREGTYVMLKGISDCSEVYRLCE